MSPVAKQHQQAPAFISTNDRRAAPRKSMRLQAAIRIPGRPTLTTNTVDISADGVCVETPYAVDPATECEVDINLAVCGTVHLIKLYGRVCYSVAIKERQHRIGMQFVRMRSEVANLVSELLK